MNKLNNYYFTFGSYPDFPFHNGYIIVVAESQQQAIAIFRAKYPDMENSGCVNCSDFYTEEYWKLRCSIHYKNIKPFEILSLCTNTF